MRLKSLLLLILVFTISCLPVLAETHHINKTEIYNTQKKRAVITPPSPPVTPFTQNIEQPATETLPVLPYDDRVVVLMYHHISPIALNDSSITTQQFTEQMRYLKDNGYNVISMPHFLSYMDGKASLPSKAVLITFDDGYSSFYEYAYPILKEYKFYATAFVIVSLVGTTAPGSSLSHFTWNEMKEMQSSGLISFGSHTYDMHYYALANANGVTKPALSTHIYKEKTGETESEDEYENRIRDDLALSKLILQQHLGTTINVLAYPYGSTNSTATKIAQEVGFRFMFNVAKGTASRGDNITKLKRVNGGSSNITVPVLAAAIGDVIYDSLGQWTKVYIKPLS